MGKSALDLCCGPGRCSIALAQRGFTVTGVDRTRYLLDKARKRAVAHALVIPNWVAGPSNLVAFAVLFTLRVRPEERMMLEQFGDEYTAYMARTERLVPGVW